MTVFGKNIIETLSIDSLIFGFEDGLKILLVKHRTGISAGRWALPGGWICHNESLDDAAHRILYALTGVSDVYLEQLRAFGSLDRFPEKRVVTVAYYALVKPNAYKLIPGFTASDARWFAIQNLPSLPYDHNDILSFGLKHLRHIVKHEPIGFNLLPEKFTLLHLQELYESILGIKLDKPNFRRKMIKMQLLTDGEEKERGVAHRAAKLYRFDKSVYDEWKKKGFNFEF